jgi:hypothetical protein
MRELEDVEHLLRRVRERGYFKRHEAEFLELFFIPIVPSDATEEYLVRWRRLYEETARLARKLPVRMDEW